MPLIERKIHRAKIVPKFNVFFAVNNGVPNEYASVLGNYSKGLRVVKHRVLVYKSFKP